jgi:nucleoside-diphosphate-sugar epimerase
MNVVVAGGHGQIGLRLLSLLAERGDQARGLIRNPEYADDLLAVGAVPAYCDLEGEDDISRFVEGADAVVFAAGAGPGSGAARKQTVDLGGALKLIDAAKANGVARYVMISAIGTARPDTWAEEMRPYYEAKAGADRELEAAGLDHTIVRPGRLTDAPGTRRVHAAPEVEYGEIPRDDVAAVIVAVLDTPSTIGKAFDLVSGATSIEEAVAAL